MIVSNSEIIDFIMSTFPNALPEHIELIPIHGGRNNRAYHLKINSEEYFLKHYNKSIDTNRSRLNAEYEFLKYAEACECEYVTRSVAYDEVKGMSIHEYISGIPYRRNEIYRKDIVAALQFIIDINKQRFFSHAKKLLSASESCFSLEDHIQCVDLRVDRLNTIVIKDHVDEMADQFVRQALFPTWFSLKNQFLSDMEEQGMADEVLSMENRVISPSDFGFHNALKLQDGKVKFVDFEYSGWDDPAKLTGDFFNQIEVPVSLDYFPLFAKKLSEIVFDKDKMISRMAMLLPVYRIKWVCIVLNYFLPFAKQGKNFVGSITEHDRHTQLDKAKKILDSLNEVKQISKRTSNEAG